MKRQLWHFVEISFLGVAIYCVMAATMHWPLNNVVWSGAACGFLWAAWWLEENR